MNTLLIGAGMLSIQHFVSVGQIVKTGLDITNTICTSINEINSIHDNTIQKLIDESNLECMIRTVESILRQKDRILMNEGKVLTTQFNDTEYILVPTQHEFFELSCPEDIVMYYLYESTNKINTLLISIKKKQNDHKNTWFKFWYVLDLDSECNKLKSYIKQLKERITLYGVVKKN
jgi:hypothetical protein